MLIEFSVANFRSFKERATLSMEAAPDDWLEESHVAAVGGRRFVKAAAIYGPNASGKTNFMAAINTFHSFVANSSKESQKGEQLPFVPFVLSTETESAPSHFEIVFLHNGTRYRYGFEATAEVVTAEWLFRQRDSIRETRLFTREAGRIAHSAEFNEAKGLKARTRPNALFLSVVAQFNGRIAGEVMDWMGRLNNVSGLEDAQYMPFTAQRLKEKEYTGLILDLVRKADVGIEDLRTVDVSANEMAELFPADFPEQLRSDIMKKSDGAFMIRTGHRRFDGQGKDRGLVEFNLKTEESHGTRKFVALSGPVLHTLKEGSILFVDELEARLHPLLTRALVELFNSSANRNGAQLIFATHDGGLLDSSRIRRDQVWFVEKDDYGASQLYSLQEFKVRKEAKFAKEYLLGQFGGVPRVGDFTETITQRDVGPGKGNGLKPGIPRATKPIQGSRRPETAHEPK